MNRGFEIVAVGRPWSFDGDGALFWLVSEAQRIRLAHLFDPLAFRAWKKLNPFFVREREVTFECSQNSA
jgi:hypothetical protein